MSESEGEGQGGVPPPFRYPRPASWTVFLVAAVSRSVDVTAASLPTSECKQRQPVTPREILQHQGRQGG